MTRLDGPGWPDFELADFAGALGEAGRAEPDVLGRTPFGIRILREQLAELSGDVDRYVAVLAENLYAAPQYLKIVAALRVAGRSGDAEGWARRGLSRLGNPIEMDKLRDAYVDLLLDRGATGEALTLRQERFEQNPTQPRYEELRAAAHRTGHWPGMRDKAIERLRGAVTENPAVANHAIAVLLDEDEPDEAWQIALSYPGEVLESRWHELIDVRRHGHPAEVIGPLQQLIEQRLAAGGDKHRYSRAITTIRQLRAAHHAAGDDSGLATYLDDLRRRHKRKTSFLAKLDRAKL